MQSILSNKVFWGIVITFVISGIGGITGLVSPSLASWLSIVVLALTGIGHTVTVAKANLIAGYTVFGVRK